MAIRILALVIAGTLSGCTTEQLVRDNLLPECPGYADRATSRAAACMTAAMYEIALEKAETSEDESSADQDEQADLR